MRGCKSCVDFWLIRVKRTFHTPFSKAERSSCVRVTPRPSSLGLGVTLTQDGNEPKIRSMTSFVCAMKKIHLHGRMSLCKDFLKCYNSFVC